MPVRFANNVRVTNKRNRVTECWCYKSEFLCYYVLQNRNFVILVSVLRKRNFMAHRATKGSIHNTAEVGEGSDRPRFLRAL